jgi:hypothetical protein
MALGAAREVEAGWKRWHYGRREDPMVAVVARYVDIPEAGYGSYPWRLLSIPSSIRVTDAWYQTSGAEEIQS